MLKTQVVVVATACNAVRKIRRRGGRVCGCGGMRFVVLEFGELDGDARHLDELDGRFVVLESLHQIEYLAPHHRHLLLEGALVEALVFLNA